MPRLVADAMAVFPRVREVETKAPGVPRQPLEFPGTGKPRVEAGVAGRRDIERATGVMFAATRRGDEPQDVADALARGQFLADDSGLPGDAAETGDGQQSDAVFCGRRVHPAPCRRGARREPDRAAVRIAPDGHEHPGLALHRQVPGPRVISGDAQPGPDGLETLSHLSRRASARPRSRPGSPCPPR
mgnify:CR=1 FL=1